MFNAPCNGTVRGFTRLVKCGSAGRTIAAAMALAMMGGLPAHGQLVISQVYGGGGSGASPTYNADYIELFNRSSSPVNLSGWSVQYAASAGTLWNKINLTGTIPANGYFLIRTQNTATGTALPTPDLTSTAIAISATAGKVALRNSTTTLTGLHCYSVGTDGVIDFVGWGTGTTCGEGTTVGPTTSNTLILVRRGAGCQDTDNNNADFVALTAVTVAQPRNSSSPPNPCGGCCISSGCFVTNAGDCSVIAGQYLGNGSTCESACPVGACCVVETCSQITEEACTQAGGIWSGGALCGGVRTYAAPNPGAAPNTLHVTIPDATGVPITRELTIPDAFNISKLRLRFEVAHTWYGDIRMILTHVDTGTAVTIMMNATPDDNSDLIAGGFYVMDDDAATTFDSAAAAAGATISHGSYRPDIPLSAFIGQSAAGVWRLAVSDHASGDVGVLYNWGLLVEGAASPCLVPDGACCLATGCQQLGEQSCLAQGGTSWAEGVDCEDANCPPMGRCCAATGACSMLTEAACLATAGNSWNGDETCDTACELGACCVAGACTPTTQAGCAGTWTAGADCPVSLTEGFDDITTLPGAGWTTINRSSPLGVNSWFQGVASNFPAFSGVSTSYISVNYNSGASVATISNWLITPVVTLQNGMAVEFYTRTATASPYPDRLQARMSTAGSSVDVGSTATSVGDFTTILLDINPNYTTSGYPQIWTKFTVIVSGLGSPTAGRFAFRYFVENGGPSGANSNIIGIDSVRVIDTCAPAGTGACCLATGCTELIEASCLAMGGTWQQGVDCIDSGCAPVGRCCAATGECSLLTQDACLASAGSSWDGSGDCTNPCTTGACCLPSGCALMTQAGCDAAGGCYQGDASACGGSVATLFEENFDDVTAPALPSDWIANNAVGSGALWVTSASGNPAPPFHTAPNAAFVDNPSTVSDKRLTSPVIALPYGPSALTFRNNFAFETPNYDGGVLEIAVNNGPFTDILAAGGTFLFGGYTGTVNTCCSNPLSGRAAWVGVSSGYLNTTVKFPASAEGQSIVLRWRMGSDSTVAGTGWRIDTISIANEQPNCPVIVGNPTNVGACDGGMGSFTVGASGSGLSYQWRRNGQPLSDGGNISGANTATLTINPASASDIDTYDVVVSAGLCSQTSAAASLSLQPNPSASAGGPYTTCLTNSVALTGSAGNVANIEWSTSGTGTFTNGSSVNATYHPSAADAALGSVTLTITAHPVAPCATPAVSGASLTFEPTFTYFADLDGDTFGSSISGTLVTCDVSAPSGYATTDDDCNDGNPDIHPGAPESCNGLDDDCDGETDEGFDGDGDGYTVCAGDCDDADPLINPGAAEICNGLDDDCDSLIDDDDDSITGQVTWYCDDDGDAYGRSDCTVVSCTAPPGYAAQGGDCDDGNPDVNPGSPEICDGVDQDCDRIIDNPCEFLDSWTTCGPSHYDFTGTPIPADFFGPGSEPFVGTVCLASAASGLTNTDTIVRRFGDPNPSPTEPVQIPIEIVALQLQSCAPITVHYPSGPSETWLLETLNPTGSTGIMFVDRSSATGGTFMATLQLQWGFAFTRLDPPATDPPLAFAPPPTVVQVGPSSWTNTPPVLDPPLVGCGGCTFNPGVDEAGLTPCGFFHQNGQVTICHAQFLPPPPTGACCLLDGSCVDGVERTACESIGGHHGVYVGDNSTCATATCPAIANDELGTTAIVAGELFGQPFTFELSSLQPVDTIVRRPVLPDLDGDTIPTEMLAMNLTGSGVTLTLNGTLPSRGQVLNAMTDGNGQLTPPGAMFDSFFDVFFEIDLGPGGRLHNTTPAHVTSSITELPPAGSTYSGTYPPGALVLFDENETAVGYVTLINHTIRQKRCIYVATCVSGPNCGGCGVSVGQQFAGPGCVNTCPGAFSQTCGDSGCCVSYELIGCKPWSAPDLPTGEPCTVNPCCCEPHPDLAINCPDTIAVECDSPTLPSHTGQPNVSGGCTPYDITYADGPVLDPPPGSCPVVGYFIRTWMVSDGCGDFVSCEQIIQLIDTTAPSIACPPNASYQCIGHVPTASAAQFIFEGGTASDNCGPVTITHLSDIPLGGTGCAATPLVIHRAYRATDSCGNTADCEQVITVADTIAPVVTCSGDLSFPVDPGTCGATISYPAATAEDNCDGSVAAWCSIASGAVLAVGTHTITCSATDACGNLGTCNFEITVFDNEAPVLTCPGDMVLDCGEQVVNYSVSVSDNCPDPNFPICNIASGSTFPVGTTTVTCMATDAAGNFGVCSFSVTINPDPDSDGDGVTDCNDGCPLDPNKIAPGICGCGVPDDDSDGDGTPDCNDGCPLDPNKIDPGICGCGVPDVDSDGDGIYDCNDNCPNTSNPNQDDFDGDGVGDVCDNCPFTSNPSQTDTDSDGLGDVCDNCPNDFNPNQENFDADQYGDACDPDIDNDGVLNEDDECPFTPLGSGPVNSSGCSCADIVCQNGATCLNGECICPPGFYGQFCQFEQQGACCTTNGCVQLSYTQCQQAGGLFYPDAPACPDSDGDGTDDCNDGCPNDPDKIAPGICGCGVADVPVTYYLDVDGDGYGDAFAPLNTFTCLHPTPPLGHVENAGDCDDSDPAVYPGATEFCNGVDDDCNGVADDNAVDALMWWADADGDGYGDPNVILMACTQPAGYVDNPDDCDDGDPQVGAAPTWYVDADGDGYGNPDPNQAIVSCDNPSGTGLAGGVNYVLDNTDCDDANSAINPGAQEVCNGGIDDDCDGLADDDDDSVAGQSTWYRDFDGDGFGDANDSTLRCTQPSGYVSLAGDCDDNNPAINPDATEMCNGADDDCDGSVDEGNVCSSRLALTGPAAGSCLTGNQAFTVAVSMADLGGFPAAGFQAFLQYDSDLVTFISGEYTATPFGLPIITPIAAGGGGVIDLASGIDVLNGQSPSSANATVALLHFVTNASPASVCAPGAAPVWFRAHEPPSRVTDSAGQALLNLGLVDAAAVLVDATAPTVTSAPDDVQGQCAGDIPAPDTAAVEAMDDCSVPVVTHLGDSSNAGAGCADDPLMVTRTYRVTDGCGNYVDVTQTITIADTIAPTLSGQGSDHTIDCPAVPQFTAPSASDNCTANPQVVVVSDDTVAGTCPGTYSRTVTWKAIDACGNESATVSQTITVVDTTPPVLSGQGADATIECPATPVFTAPTASDACDPNPQVVEVSDVTNPGTCAGAYWRTVTWMAIDACGNPSETVSQTITVVDITPPVLSGQGSNATIECPATPVFTTPTASDACDPNPQVVELSDVTTPGSCAGAYSRTVTWMAIDACGNPSATVSQTITVADTTPPVFDVTCPLPPIQVYSDAGLCGASAATVNAIAPPATDACSPTTVVGTVNGGPLPSVYNAGLTTIVWTATDDCGNASTCEQHVVVGGDNQVVLDVQLSPTVAVGISRCITFEFYNCNTATTYTVNQLVTFGAGGLAEDVTVLVPCSEGPFSCVTARDRLHSLRRTLPLSVNGVNYEANFIGIKSLTGGNLNDDGYIDILDFGTFAGQFNQTLPPPTCGTSAPHSDISGDGLVHMADFTFIQINFLKLADPSCCGLGRGVGRSNGPITRISVEDLWASGLGQLTVADLNGDGWLDQQDIAAFLNGAEPPQVSVFASGQSGSWFDAANWGNGLTPDEQTSAIVPDGSSVIIDQPNALANSVTARSGATIHLTGAGTLRAHSLTVVSGAALILDDPRCVLRVRQLVVEAGAALVFSAGVIEIDGGTLLVIDGEFTIGIEAAATLRLLSDATVSAQSVIISVTGALEGDGVVIGDVVNQGLIAPDPDGRIEFIGDLQQGPNGRIEVELRETEDSPLIIHGQANLNGHLRAELRQRYIPAVGARFSLLSAVDGGSVIAQFATVELPDLGPDLSFLVQYELMRVGAIVQESP